MNEGVLRTFVAVEVASLPVKRSLETAQAGLRRVLGTPDPVKWVPAHQMHITLKFLGDIPEEAAPRVMAALERATAGRLRFKVQVTGLGAFPSVQRPSVLWAGLGAGKESLVALAAAVEAELDAEGFPREKRPFQPHLTLGRVREGARLVPGLVPALERGSGQEFGQWPVQRVLLMTSQLTPTGPIYSVYGSAPLGEENSPAPTT